MGAPTSAAGASSSDIASANDAGAVAVITEDPSCAAQHPVLNTWVDVAKNGWQSRDPSIPATDWTPEVRTQHEEVGQAMRSAADQLVPLVKLTPHRAMRELYEQFIAYARAYANSIPTYTPPADNLARATIAASEAIGYICAAIGYGSAAARGPLLPALSAPSEVASVGDPSDPQRFLTEPNPTCGEWAAAVTQFDEDTADWRKTDPDIPASQWSPHQRALNDEVGPVMKQYASKLGSLGEQSGNSTWRDFAALSLQYRNAYVLALPTYTAADRYLNATSSRLNGMVKAACQAIDA
ncbi:hypothetical protein H7I55_06465 [Mycolicibacterium setense]|nr:hypothetical protein [Mycolicibacterium setense]